MGGDRRTLLGRGTMRNLVSMLVLVTATIAAAGDAGAPVKTADGPVGKIAVSAAGAVSFDGAPVTLDALRAKLAALKERNGVVWYYREAGTQAPPPQAMEVIKLIVDTRVPITMSTKPDYSDVVMPDGTVQPRD